MAQPLAKLFSEQDLKRIEASVREAEQRTGGEIVPYVVQASDAYEHAFWRAAVLFGVIGFCTFVLVYHFTELSWGTLAVAELAISALAGSLIGMILVATIPGVKRMFAGNDAIELRVRQRAAEAFLAEEVFKTRDRTGILIFLSLLEHKVVVLGDTGINAKVEPGAWESIVNMIVEGMRRRKAAEALADAIRACGNLLERAGVARRPDDSDELRNQLRTG